MTRPDWITRGTVVVDLAKGLTGKVHAVQPTYGSQGGTEHTVFVLPLGGGIGWEAEHDHLRPAGSERSGSRQ